MCGGSHLFLCALAVRTSFLSTCRRRRFSNRELMSNRSWKGWFFRGQACCTVRGSQEALIHHVLVYENFVHNKNTEIAFHAKQGGNSPVLNRAKGDLLTIFADNGSVILLFPKQDREHWSRICFGDHCNEVKCRRMWPISRHNWNPDPRSLIAMAIVDTAPEERKHNFVC